MSQAPHIHEPVAGFCGALDSDEKLVQSARSGNNAAFVELWRRHSSTVFRAAYRIVKNREDAEDLAQETFLKAFDHLQSFNGTSKFSTWLVRIGINSALGELCRRRSPPLPAICLAPLNLCEMPPRAITPERSRLKYSAPSTVCRNSISRGRSVL